MIGGFESRRCAWQRLPPAFSLTADDATSTYWIDAGGRQHRGERAVARALVEIGGLCAVLGLPTMLTGVRVLAAVPYRLIARTRHLMPGGSPCLSGLRPCGARRRGPANRLAAIQDRLSDVPLVRGTTVHIGQIKHGRAGDRYSGVVVMDDGDHLVLQAVWLHENELGVARFEPGDVATEHYWRSRYVSIWEVRGPAGLRGWYCNVARPVVLSGGTIESRDLELDVWISADWTTHVVLDEDEFDASPLIARHPGLAAEARRAARFLSELTPTRLQELLATEPTADVGRRRHHRPA